MRKEDKLLEVLRQGLVEIRLLSTKANQDYERINMLANLLHNLPKGIKKIDDFDFDFLKNEIKRYSVKYDSTLISEDLLK